MGLAKQLNLTKLLNKKQKMTTSPSAEHQNDCEQQQTAPKMTRHVCNHFWKMHTNKTVLNDQHPQQVSPSVLKTHVSLHNTVTLQTPLHLLKHPSRILMSTMQQTIHSLQKQMKKQTTSSPSFVWQTRLKMQSDLTSRDDFHLHLRKATNTHWSRVSATATAFLPSRQEAETMLRHSEHATKCAPC